MSDDLLLSLAESAARRAGEYLRGRFGGATVARTEGRDVKLEEDAAAEILIVEELRKSGLPILGEEGGIVDGGAIDVDAAWVVDPLDGSFNFSRGLEPCAIAIGLLRDGAPSGGVVYDFVRDRICIGGRGVPARCNGEVTSVSKINLPSEAVLATGFPVNFAQTEKAMRILAARISRFKKVRMIGSAASSLALVARGIVDVYHEDDIMLWDIAAGAALVTAAGGVVEISQSPRVEHAVRLTAAANTSLAKAASIC